MCGIAGFFLNRGKADPSLLTAMCDVIRHRGPDDAGYHLDGSAAIGMRRLSIIDLAAGHQPISNEDGSVWVVFNGEIYNYRELREWLIGRGHTFRTQSDTETLVHLYEEEGTEGIRRLRGMFAYCIWDARRRKMLLVRDRLGKKPLYYASLGDGFFFGSELKCLRVADLPVEIDDFALKLYFQFTWIPDPWTIFKSARKLPPGCWLERGSDGSVRIERYWTFPVPQTSEPSGISEEQMRHRIRDKFDEAVRMRMIADVPLGAFLSGGIDSSSVVASMALQSPDPVRTFSIGFEEADYNELDYARLVAQKYKTEHHEIVVRPNSVELAQKLAAQFDEPFGDSSAIPTYIVSEFAARHVKVALSGDGGDELFAGYDIFQIIPQLASFDRIPAVARRLLGRIAGALPYQTPGKNFLHMLSRDSAVHRYFERNYAPYQMRRQLLSGKWMLSGDYRYLDEDLAQCFAAGERDALTQALYFEATCKLPGDMLVKVDRMSMLASLEVRCPLLDHELAELSSQVPHHWKIRDGRGKAILTDALADRLPPELLRREKMGFAVPLAPWLRGPLREMVRDILGSRRFREREVANASFVEHLIEEHQNGKRDNRTWLWALLMLEMWFLDVEAHAPAAVSR